MGWGLLQGLGQGLNQAGTMLMSNHFDKMKEERLRNFQSKQSAQDRSFSADQNKLNREQSAEQAGLDRTQNQTNSDRTYRLQEQQFTHGREMDRDQLEIAKQNASANTNAALIQMAEAAQQVEINQFTIDQNKALQELWDKATDPAAPDPEKEAAATEYTRLVTMQEDDGENFQFGTVGQYDDNGYKTGEQLYRANRRTGEYGFQDGLLNQSSSAVPQDAINDLLADSSAQTIREFEEVFGQGSAARFLRNQR